MSQVTVDVDYRDLERAVQELARLHDQAKALLAAFITQQQLPRPSQVQILREALDTLQTYTDKDSWDSIDSMRFEAAERQVGLQWRSVAILLAEHDQVKGKV